MRIWSLHPKHLDSRGLVALWREGLLAQAVLRGQTKGYRHHPQLTRFRYHPTPIGAIAKYLRVVHKESLARGYRFRASKIHAARCDAAQIAVGSGQLQYEWNHLLAKLKSRNREWGIHLERVNRPRPHPLFQIVPGGIEAWERLVDVAQQGVVKDHFSRRR